MDKQEILDYNKRCAEFLGWIEQTDPTERWFGCFKHPNGGIFRNTPADPLLFHEDWNWIMEVVEAIRNTNNPKPQGDTTHLTLKVNIQAHLGRVNKEAVVESINQFLIWHKS